MSTPYLQNASAKKDADGNYWLFIQSGALKAMFQLMSADDDEEDSIPRRALDAWLAEQDSANGKGKSADM